MALHPPKAERGINPLPTEKWGRPADGPTKTTLLRWCLSNALRVNRGTAIDDMVARQYTIRLEP